ncbi:hypothetical protein GUITHDRAFT_149151 [Guillardia theta CCMP2712]|uniref:Uncharacterized protein n=1 Tax=Guillardia theta (strain CCMP2712) TaxID=905079 RepID=L1I5Z4_GUITC|nr:hypothetical protein GUITHDRAFT_149151 [Guillardia theta CCMP2712]EKX31671.1 hypothetical protein GUITHDRAFT_149151 [Guillardia theta CCMP2712]|eukprot:XP_005818651.1 hypothetical protein GUITHDRAFT_149151 [Guillardia theta CCMP2712]
MGAQCARLLRDRDARIRELENTMQLMVQHKTELESMHKADMDSANSVWDAKMQGEKARHEKEMGKMRDRLKRANDDLEEQSGYMQRLADKLSVSTQNEKRLEVKVQRLQNEIDHIEDVERITRGVDNFSVSGDETSTPG